MWGDKETQFFYDLSPDRILDAVDAHGFRTTGRCLALNSMENRVHEVEIESPFCPTENPTRSDYFAITKFYRPGRWTQEQILEEHKFLKDLEESEVPIIAPIERAGKTLFKCAETDLLYAIFPKKGGRNPDELDTDQLERLGRLLARLHSVGKQHLAQHRLKLGPASYGQQNLDFILAGKHIPAYLESNYKDLVKILLDRITPMFKNVINQRIHGDCHWGNLIWDEQQFTFIDFDDMVSGPPVQDIWLLLPGRDDETKKKRDIFLNAYETFFHFENSSLKLIEPLRALRFIHFSAWIAKRWEDPAFKLAFPHFGSDHYWNEQILDIRDQLANIEAPY